MFLTKLVKKNHSLSIEAENIIYAKDYFDPSSTNYSMLTADDIILKYSGNKIELPVAKVVYTNYLIDTDKEPKQEWVRYFEKKIYNDVGDFGSPIIIRESWCVYMDNMKIEIVNCNNFIYNHTPYIPEEQYAQVQTVPQDNSIVYNATSIFINDEIYSLDPYSIAEKVSLLPPKDEDEANKTTIFSTFTAPTYKVNVLVLSIQQKQQHYTKPHIYTYVYISVF